MRDDKKPPVHSLSVQRHWQPWKPVIHIQSKTVKSLFIYFFPLAGKASVFWRLKFNEFLVQQYRSHFWIPTFAAVTSAHRLLATYLLSSFTSSCALQSTISLDLHHFHLMGLQFLIEMLGHKGKTLPFPIWNFLLPLVSQGHEITFVQCVYDHPHHFVSPDFVAWINWNQYIPAFVLWLLVKAKSKTRL